MCSWILKRVPTLGLLEDKGGQWKRAGWTWKIQRRSVPVFHGENVAHRSCVPGAHTMTLLFLSILFEIVSSCMCTVITLSSVPVFLAPDRHTSVGDWFLHCKWPIHLSPYGGGWWDYCLAIWQLIDLRQEERSWSIEGFSIVKQERCWSNDGFSIVN